MSRPILSTRPLGAERAVELRDLVNSHVGDQPWPGTQVELWSCHDLDALPDAPKHRPGIRVFWITVDQERGPQLAFLLGAREPEADHIRVPVGELLRAISGIESHLGRVDAIAQDHSRHRWPPADHDDAHVTLSDVTSDGNRICDGIRSLKEDPTRWPLIGPDAELEAHWCEIPGCEVTE